MIPPVIVPPPVLSPIYLVGQAPGSREGVLGRPFAWTAGRRLFEWFGGLGVDETTFRDRVYIAAVCRCFPGKTTGGGDRAPDALEIQNCSRWMADELTILRPKLVLTVGKLATERFLGKGELVGWIGASHDGAALGWKGEVIPLPHPSGASSWWKVEPGKTLTRKALGRIGKHPVWRAVFSRR
jgi:uracil-DNA glycosylase